MLQFPYVPIAKLMGSRYNVFERDKVFGTVSYLQKDTAPQSGVLGVFGVSHEFGYSAKKEEGFVFTDTSFFTTFRLD